jgi:hypothetical protein
MPKLKGEEWDVRTVRIGVVLLVALLGVGLKAEERTERFDRDPGWDGHNNQPENPKPRTIRQDFGYSRTTYAASMAGEIGGFISAAAEPAYYAKRLPKKGFEDALTASGTLTCTGEPFHVLVGFFNSNTLNEWRTPNTLALRLSGRGDVFYAWVEYATARWRAGGDSPQAFPTQKDARTGRTRPKGFPVKGAVYRWSLTYDPRGNNGTGVITATIGEHKAVCHLREGHKADGAEFNHFGLLNVMKHAGGGGMVWLGDLTVNGVKEDLSKDPGWDGFQNHRTYVTADVRPRFHFGYSPTSFAGGEGKGELGGLVFRGDCRYPAKMAYYGDRLEELTLAKPLRASGKVCLRRGVTDSTVLIGFFHSRDSMRVNSSQDSGLPSDFLGVSIDGPSREGFYFAPAYRVHEGRPRHGTGTDLPHVYPDGTSHAWSLEYSPGGAGGRGQIVVRLGKQIARLDLKEGDRTTRAHFDRFGIVTTWIDGNGQQVYFDDLTYTCKQE